MDNIVFVFDFDGVIVDSINALYEVYIGFLREFGFKGNKEEFNLLNGPKISEIVSLLKEKHNINKSEQELSSVYCKNLSSIYKDARLNIGVEESLKMLKDNNIKIALASSSKKIEIESILNKFKLNQFFDFIISGDEVGKAKPSPEIYNVVKKKYPNHEYYVVEDSENGLQAAISNKMKTIFYNPKNRKTEKNVTYEIDSLHRIKEIITEIDLNCFTISKSRNITLQVVEHELYINALQEQTVEDLWNSELKKRQLFNGKIVSYHCHKKLGDTLHIECFVTQYKYFFAQLKNPELYLEIRPIGVSGVILDEDNNTMLAVRHNVTEYNGFYEFVPAGSVDSSKTENDLISFKEQIIEEFEEETQIKRENIKNIEPYCLIFDNNHGVYDICAKIYINGLLEHLIDSKQNEEYRNITIVKLAGIHKEIEIDKNNCVPTSIVALINLV